MDNGLVLCNEVKYGTSDFAVLILIIVDNGLVHRKRLWILKSRIVLILVVVDNGLVHQKKLNFHGYP